MTMPNEINVRTLLAKYGLFAKKNYGQNFLTDKHVLKKIVDSAEITADDLVIEIGAGLGMLTRELAKRAKKVIAFEIDSELVNVLNDVLADLDNIEIINQDVLTADINALIGANCEPGTACKLVANLPYYITTPIIFGIFENKTPIKSMTVMVQKEVGDRMRAKPSTKEYGALSVGVQYYSEVYLVANVPRNCFVPRPDIDSAVIRLTLHDNPGVSVDDEKMFFAVTKAAFSKRRKTLINCLSSFDDFMLKPTKEQAAEIVRNSGLDENIRGEALSLDELAVLTNEYLRLMNKI